MSGVVDASPASWAITGLWHGGIAVSDMEQSLRFYRDGLALEVVVDRVASDEYLFRILALRAESIRIVYLRIPQTSSMIELLEFRGIEREPVSARPCDPGCSHLCLYVSGIDALHSRLKGMGFPSRAPGPTLITAGPNLGAKGLYMIDPDGYLLELFERPSAAGP